MTHLEFGCRPTIIGSMPHTDPSVACSVIVKYLGEIPAWPQLPRRAFRENMYAQFSEGFPGVVIKENRMYIDRRQDIDMPLEALYAAYLENNADRYPTSPEYAAGLHHCLSLKNIAPLAVKGQITGPVTWGLTVTDENNRAIIYDDILGDAVTRFLRLKAAWQEKRLREVCPDTIIFVDEPYMATYGSITTGFLSRERVINLLEEVFGGISGLKGVHCCGNTDWSVLLDTTTDILSFDAYNYGPSLSLYPTEIGKFLGRGGAIAWGIVPNDVDSLARESVASLKDRLEETIAPFTRNGAPVRHLIARGLLTPSCGLDSLTETAATQVLELLAELSTEIRKRYV